MQVVEVLMMAKTQKSPMPPQSTDKIPVWIFARDLWEAIRRESRLQLGDAVTEEEFTKSLPPWEDLDPQVRTAKILLARDELLKLLDRAGYEVRKKGKQ